MKHALRTALTCLFLAPACWAMAQNCFYTLRMFADDGNGWGGSYVTICVSGDCNDHTLAAGAEDELQIPVNIGQQFLIAYTAMGGDQTAIHYRLDLYGQPVFNSSSPPIEGLQFANWVDCEPPPSPMTDCAGAYVALPPTWFICNAPFLDSGNMIDLDASNQGCLEQGEVSGYWYRIGDAIWPFNVGELVFTISPAEPADYDFALWGPFPYGTEPSSVCPPPGEPFRCSYAATTGPTGLSFSATETSQDASGDGFVAPVDNSTGFFLLYVGHKDGNDHQYTITWNLSTGEEHKLEVGNRQLQIQPNPADQHTTVFLPGSEAHLHTLEVVDALGRQVLQAPVPRSSASAGVPLALDGLANGTYLVLARDAHGALLGHARLLKH
jgi:hypothetical protein